MQAIADRANISKSLLHYHFRSKTHLLSIVVDPFLASAEATASSLTSRPDVEPVEVLSQYLSLVLEHRDVVRLLNTDVTTTSEAKVGDRYHEIQRSFRQLLHTDDARAAAAIGVLTRPVVVLAETTTQQVQKEASKLIEAAQAVLSV